MTALASLALIGLVTTSVAVIEPTPLSDVRLEGELGACYQAATYNLVTRTDRYSLESFASSAAGKPGALWWDWPGDQIGRWLSVLHVAEGLGWTPAASQRKLVGDTVLPLQTPDGHFGVPGSVSSDDVRILSGNAFTLAGMMNAYRDTGEARYLEAARRLAGYFEILAPSWETRRDGHLHEFYGHCMGRFLMHQSWKQMLQAYNIFAGRLWPLVLLAVAMLPSLMFWLRKTA
jgi:hypothetical protein